MMNTEFVVTAYIGVDFLFKSNLSLYLMYHAEACNELAGAHSRVIAPGQRSFFRRNVAELAILCPIWPARDLNLRSPAPETNALPLDQLAGADFLLY